MYEDLDQLWNDLEARLSSRFLLFPPAAISWEEPVVEWDAEEGLDGFLELAESLGVPILYVTVNRFSEDSISELQDRLLHPGGPHPGTAAILSRAEEHLDRIASIEIGWMFQGVGHFCTVEAAWKLDLEAEIADEEDYDAMELAAERLLLEEQRQLIPEWARRVAQIPQFQQSRTMSQRAELVPQLIPEIGDITGHYRHGEWIARRLIQEVTREALRVFTYEVRPAQEAELARQSHELLTAGLRKYEVAARLGLSRERLNRLIARYPAEGSTETTSAADG